MRLRMLAGLLGLLGLLVNAGAGRCAQVALAPAASLRVVNPDVPGDVRVLYRFALPEDAVGADIVRAFLTVRTGGDEEMPLSVAPVDQAWTETDSWSGLVTKLAESPGFSSHDGRAIIGSNALEQEGGTPTDVGMEVVLTSVVQDWASGGTNNGVCIRRVAGRQDNVAGVLDESMDPPELVIIYVPGE